MTEDGATETITIPMSAYRKLGEVISIMETVLNDRWVTLQFDDQEKEIKRAMKLKAEAWQELGI